MRKNSVPSGCVCKYRFDWSGKAEMATKYITLVTNKQTNKILTHFLYYLSGAYSNWEYNDKSPENFCEYTPFMFAFVILILFWVLFGIGIFREPKTNTKLFMAMLNPCSVEEYNSYLFLFEYINEIVNM